MIQIPKNFMRKPIAGSLEKLLSNGTTAPVVETHPAPLITNHSDLSGYIFVPSIGMYMAKERTHQGLNWYQTHEALHAENKRMPAINEFKEFLKYLKENSGGIPGASVSEIQNILDSILTVRSPWRAEWLDADFKVNDKRLYIHYNHRTVNGQLVPCNKEVLTDYLTKDKAPGIDLESWIANASSHGLPKPKIKKGELYYWAPMKDNQSVARFGVGSVWAYLYCYRNPQDSVSDLGVRAVRAKN